MAQLRSRITTKARAAALVAAVLAGTATPALAWVDVQTGGQDAQAPLVAVSDTGNARGGECWDAGQNICFTNQDGALTVSGTGTSTGGTAVSGTGNATSTGIGWSTPVIAASGAGCATAGEVWAGTAVAVSGTGCATAANDRGSGYVVAVSGTGCSSATKSGLSGLSVALSALCGSSGTVALSGMGNSSSSGEGSVYTLYGPSAPAPRLAASGTGEAHGGAVSVAGGDATAYGGLLCVSATGDCRGASVYNVCPMGYCE